MQFFELDYGSAILEPFPGIFAFDFGRYLVAATLIALVLTLGRKDWLVRRVVRSRAPAARQRRREFGLSLFSAVIFAVVGLGVYHGAAQGVLHVYSDIADYGWAYWAFSLAIMIVTHDAYFYWMHRLMHRRGVFGWMHRAHHRSVAPTQWAAYAFAPAEAIVQALFVPLFLAVVPAHASVIFAWMAHQVLRNVLGHCGVELMPRQWLATWWGRWLTTTLHHDLHHAHGHGNYGLYFTWWDRWCGTEREDYRDRLAALIMRMDADAARTSEARSS